MKNKKAYVATASSGVYSEGPFQSFDFVSPYLTFLLGFLGVTDITFIRAEGLRMLVLWKQLLKKRLEA
ncbi:MAG: NAD(P)H-dependent oxidoreductase [Bacteroidota bacterium]